MRRLAAADRSQQIEDLLALLEALRGRAEVADDALDRLFQAVEVLEGGIDLHRAVHEDTAESRVLGGVDLVRLADGDDHALRRRSHNASGPRGSLRGTASRTSRTACCGRRTAHKDRRSDFPTSCPCPSSSCRPANARKLRSVLNRQRPGPAAVARALIRLEEADRRIAYTIIWRRVVCIGRCAFAMKVGCMRASTPQVL